MSNGILLQSESQHFFIYNRYTRAQKDIYKRMHAQSKSNMWIRQHKTRRGFTVLRTILLTTDIRMYFLLLLLGKGGGKFLLKKITLSLASYLSTAFTKQKMHSSFYVMVTKQNWAYSHFGKKKEYSIASSINHDI